MVYGHADEACAPTQWARSRALSPKSLKGCLVIMARKSSSVASYEVGYGRPPVASRFRKGQSGNPSGRRKASPPPAVPDTGGLSEEDEIILRVMREAVPDKGREPRGWMTRLEAMWRAAFERAAEGDMRAAKMVREGVARAREAELALQRETREGEGLTEDVVGLLKAYRWAVQHGYGECDPEVSKATPAGREEAEVRTGCDDELAAACSGEVEAGGHGGGGGGPSGGDIHRLGAAGTGIAGGAAVCADAEVL